MRALIVADGDVPARALLDAAWPGWATSIGLVVAADGGAAAAERLGLSIDLVVGDMDSLSPEGLRGLRERGIAIERAAADKDESDTELAVLASVARGADDLTIVGAFGGPRLDHALANVGLLALPALAGRSVELLDAIARVTMICAPDAAGRPVRRPLPGPRGGIVSLLTLGCDVDGVTTEGLRFGLRDEPLRAGPARGLSNVRASVDAAVSVRRGRLLIVEPAGTLWQ